MICRLTGAGVRPMSIEDRQEFIEMTTATVAADNLAELVEQLGDIPLERIRMRPPPGTATEADVLAALEAPRKRICELIDGVLVEKPMGYTESILASYLIV